ncbi:MAG: NAD(P)H-hydrate epimerase, partial [Croceibacterium sp.]
MPASNQILSVGQMRAAEQALIDRGETVQTLMQRAGAGAAQWAWRMSAGQSVTVLCGPGNNGGDGYVIARELQRMGSAVGLVAPLEPKTEAARAARQAWDGPVVATAHAHLLVDCLFGSGQTRPLPGDLTRLLRDLAAAHAKRLAVDLPSGIDADSGTPLNPDLPAYDLTIALGAWKPAHWLMPGMATMGDRRLVPLGIGQVAGAAMRLARPLLSPPAPGAHKYLRGLVAVVAGAMPGAAALSAEAAARGGAGYVRLLTDDGEAPLSHAIVRRNGLDFDRAKAVLVGPGLGRDDGARARLTAALESGVPVV